MKKFGFLMMCVLVLLVLGFASCTTDFWDGFVDGYNSTRYRSYEEEALPNYQRNEYRASLMRVTP